MANEVLIDFISLDLLVV